MILCSFDLETSGLAIGSSKVLEAACILYDTECKKPFEFWSSWIYSTSYPPLSEEALKVNGLNKDELRLRGMHPSKAFPKIIEYFDRCDAIIGQNIVNFDMPFIISELNANFLRIPDRPWIDTRTDFEYPASVTSKRLSHIAVDHGITNIKAHSALFDAFTVLEIAKLYDIEKSLERSKSPMIRVETSPPRDMNDQLKTHRYRWDPSKRVWWKALRKCDLENEVKTVPFELTEKK